MLRRIAAAASLSALGAAPAVAADEAAFTHISCKGRPNEIRVTIDNVEKSQGLVTVELYRNEPANFLKKAGREFRLRFAAHAPLTQFCLTAPSAGKYAIVAYHDENANLKFDKNPFGLPAEPFGVSQNPVIHFAPPPIAETLVDVDEKGAAVEIRLRD